MTKRKHAWLFSPAPFIVYSDNWNDAYALARQVLPGTDMDGKIIPDADDLRSMIPVYREHENPKK